jgi:hypothetical protein
MESSVRKDDTRAVAASTRKEDRDIEAMSCAAEVVGEGDCKIAILPEEKKIYICRYGSGCTHMNEKEHMALFWHPPVPKLDTRTLRTHYICNECGQAFIVLRDLQQHLQRKTSWSNQSLLRARINCFIDGKSWQEAVVTSFRGGKHHVHCYLLGEKRWMDMTKSLFYVIYQPSDLGPALSAPGGAGTGEVKASDDDGGGLSQQDNEWLYIDNVSLDYAFTQSVLFKVYGSTIQETGYRTRGHTSLTEADRKQAAANKGSFLYGEFLPRGVDKALRENRLNASSARTLYDLGMGIGKVVMQAFLQFRNLIYVYGVELSHGRFRIAEEAALRMVDLLGRNNFIVEHVPGKSIMVIERDSENGGSPPSPQPGDTTFASASASGTDTGNSSLLMASSDSGSTCLDSRQYKKRVLHLVQGDLLDTPHIHCADIVMLETDFPAEIHADLRILLSRMKYGSRTLTYLDLRKLFGGNQKNSPFRQLEINKAPTDRYSTSWSMQRGHRFYLWTKVLMQENSPRSKGKSKSKSKKKSAEGSGSTSPSVLPQSAVERDSSTYDTEVESGISRQLDLSALAAPDGDDANSSARKSGISSFFSKIVSVFKKNVGMPDGDRRVAPLRDTYSGTQNTSRRHSRGHTEDATGLANNNFNDQGFYPNEDGSYDVNTPNNVNDGSTKVVQGSGGVGEYRPSASLLEGDCSEDLT